MLNDNSIKLSLKHFLAVLELNMDWGVKLKHFLAVLELNMDWSVKGTSPGLTSGMSSVMTTSVITGGQMTTNLTSNGEERLDLDNHDPSRGLDDLSEQNFSPGLQVCDSS